MTALGKVEERKLTADYEVEESLVEREWVKEDDR